MVKTQKKKVQGRIYIKIASEFLKSMFFFPVVLGKYGPTRRTDAVLPKINLLKTSRAMDVFFRYFHFIKALFLIYYAFIK